MKKILVVFLAGLIMLTGCSNASNENTGNEGVKNESVSDKSIIVDKNEIAEEGTNENEPLLDVLKEMPEPINDNSAIQIAPLGDFNAEEIAEKLEAKLYTYGTRFSEYAILVVKNTSEYTLEITATLQTFDINGTILAHKTKSENAIGANTETVFWFMLDEKFSSSEYSFSVSEDKHNTSIIQNLSYTSTPAKNKEIMTVTNNGDITAKYVELFILFFKDGILVNHGRTYFTDDDSEIKPNSSITNEIKAYDEYDSYFVFFTGRG